MSKLSYKVINNFLPINDFKRIQDVLFSSEINWFYKDALVKGGKKNNLFFFSHCFFNEGRIQSPLFNLIIQPCLNLIEHNSLIEIRANLTFKQQRLTKSDYHVDRNFPCKTAILYLNDCNGYTSLKYNNKLKKISSKENKLLIFDSQIKHAAVLQTDTKRRIVINFNYIKT
jgi:hypothetical protein